MHRLLLDLLTSRALITLHRNGLRVLSAGSSYFAKSLEKWRGALFNLLKEEGNGLGLFSAVEVFNMYLNKYTMIRTPEELKEAVRDLLKERSIAMDLETTGLNPRKDRVRLISIASAEKLYLIDVQAVGEEQTGKLLNELFDGKRRVIFHNAVFDLEYLFSLGVEPALESIYDTMIAEQLVRHQSYTPSLKLLVLFYLGLDIDKTLQTSDWSGELSEDQRRYAVADALLAYLIYIKQRQALIDLNLVFAATIDFNMAIATAWMRWHGTPINMECWIKQAEISRAEMERVQKELDSMVPGVNWSSPQQVLAVLNARGIKVKNTKEETLKKYMRDELVKKILEYRLWFKRANTYGQKWLALLDDTTKRFHPSWKVIGAETGRMACSSPNVMQVPREDAFRSCFQPAPGNVLIKADYSQIELRLAALIARDRTMLTAFDNGEDLHIKTASVITGKRPEEITKIERQKAKAANFGFIYGMGSTRFREYAFSDYGVDLTEEEAANARRAFMDTYRGIKWWHKQMGDTNGKPVEVRTLTGRRRITEKFTEKLNTPIQGTGADIIKLAVVELYAQRKRFPGVYPVMAVHDEIVLEAPKSVAEVAKEHLKKTMLTAAQRIVGNGVKIEVEANIYSDWSGKEVME